MSASDPHNSSLVTYFAQTDSRGRRTPFGIKNHDRSRHLYVIGKTGMGKSTLLENMAIQDIQSGRGTCFVDPHGKTADLLLDYVPENRIKDVLYFAPFDMDHPVSFNIMEDVGQDKRHLVVNGLMATFEKIWVDAWSARMAYILQNTLLALLEYPGSTLLGVNRMLVDKEYRKLVVNNVTDPSVRSFWVDEFAKYTDRYTQEATPAIQNKVGQFTSNPLIRNIVGQSKSTFNLRELMDQKKIVIINLSKGRVGEGNANLLGSMLITKIYLAAMSRADMNERELQKLPDFYLYVDEFQSFANKSFADILSEARKYKLNLTLAHQYIEQMEEEVSAAVFGNVGTMVVFRVGAFDAEVLEKEFAPAITAEDLVNLGIYQIYLKLMIDGVTSSPFSATTLPPIVHPSVSFRERILDESRARFARPRASVEGEIRDWHAPIQPAPREMKERSDQPREEAPRRSPLPERPLPPRVEQRTEERSFREPSRDRPSAPPPLSPQALSLSDLRAANKKASSPEAPRHLAELRRALSDVLKEKEEKREPSPTPATPSATFSNAPAPAGGGGEADLPGKPSRSGEAPVRTLPAEPAAGRETSSPAAEKENRAPVSGGDKKEIPEELLRKLLAVDPPKNPPEQR